jgi:tripartite-type tricarboxylate transporter receptor subunit TctC
MKRLVQVVALSTAIALSVPVAAQETNWPERPVRIIVPYPAGGAVDVMVRALSVQMSSQLGQPVVVEARPGGNSNIGADVVAGAPPDGYTLLASSPWFTINQLVENGRRWKTSDFQPIAQFATSPNYMVVGAESPAKTVADYVAMARKKPGMLYGSTGIGSTQDMAVAMFASSAGIQLEPVPYKGAPPILPDLVSGQLSMAIVAGGNATAQIKAGRLRALASTGSERSKSTPEVPTLVESGFPVTVVSWYGFHAPAGTPKAVIEKMAAAVKAATENRETQERFAAANAEAAYLGIADFHKALEDERSSWAKVVPLLEKK